MHACYYHRPFCTCTRLGSAWVRCARSHRPRVSALADYTLAEYARACMRMLARWLRASLAFALPSHSCLTRVPAALPTRCGSAPAPHPRASLADAPVHKSDATLTHSLKPALFFRSHCLSVAVRSHPLRSSPPRAASSASTPLHPFLSLPPPCSSRVIVARRRPEVAVVRTSGSRRRTTSARA